MNRRSGTTNIYFHIPFLTCSRRRWTVREQGAGFRSKPVGIVMSPHAPTKKRRCVTLTTVGQTPLPRPTVLGDRSISPTIQLKSFRQVCYPHAIHMPCKDPKKSPSPLVYKYERMRVRAILKISYTCPQASASLINMP